MRGGGVANNVCVIAKRASLLAKAQRQPEGVHAAGGTVSPRRAPEKEKEPDSNRVRINIVWWR